MKNNGSGHNNGNGTENSGGSGNGSSGSSGNGIHGVFGDNGNGNSSYNGSVNGNGGRKNNHADSPPDNSKERAKAEAHIKCSKEAFQKALDEMYGDDAPKVDVPTFNKDTDFDTGTGDGLDDIAGQGEKYTQNLKDLKKQLKQNRKYQDATFKNTMKDFKC